MKIAIIGRSELLYDSAVLLNKKHEIVCIISANEAPEYTRVLADFKRLAEGWGIPFAQGSKISDHYDFLLANPADIAISINYTGIIPQSIVDIFPLGILNAHGGDLPRYRGNACQAWAILNGEERIGLCIHKMLGGELDSGDIIAKDFLLINQKTKITEVWNWMLLHTPKLIDEAVKKLAKDPQYFLERQSKDPKKALRCYPRRPEDGKIDWNMSSLSILRLINASNKPYAGAFCNWGDKHLTIWDADLVDDEEIFCAFPGQVTKIGNGYIEVITGLGKLKLTIVELNGSSISPNLIISSTRTRLT
jgi:UDP-4-amino-4-deoxy-L-arabinose formyltransferase/UDP-glucuronic acid dehydrogenase (UDP-4-keto-hexauronic acid decarboxylating)